eukprot:CAMPEP_0204911978 /NCGR_PEP_ID=MMETSP1397-20131031/10207_1 /ASSEMBLY_ACC=CAM_ASM_000891 /TAXON_ID=49980 /ORGANISM="Climacostomum Climacostomum virens, Strain Stock W-24" /LENGTH=102 /DNA_ID=CAMNT_0052082727 /DNA_START=1 /DNA_END=306 /DNA_ORIENTATION=+
MRQAAFYLLLSLVHASLNTGEGLDPSGKPNDIKASQQRVLSYVFCWFLLVAVVIISVTVVISREPKEVPSNELKEPLLPSHFFPRNQVFYNSAPIMRGNAEH